MPLESKTLNAIPPYLMAELNRKVAAAKKEGFDVISLGMGDPDLPTPPMVVQALQEAAADPASHNYPPCQGLPEYRQAAANWMKNRFDVQLDPDREITALIGSKEGLAHVIMAYVDPGDIVLVPSPGYPVYHNYTVLVGGQPYTVPLLPENDFLPDLAAIPEEVARKAKLLFLNYPNNPTGAIAPPEFIARALAFCRRHDILLCHDNAYSEMTFEGYKAPSFLEEPGAKETCLEFFSLSKMYNMTGWRIGFAAGNEAAVSALLRVKNNTDTGIFKPVQQAGIKALDNSAELTRDINRIYGARRKLFAEGLQKLGWPFKASPATFYVWAPLPQGLSSTEFAEMMLEKCHVAVPPGIGFGSTGEGFFRVALTVPEQRLNEVLRRMEENNMTYEGLAASTGSPKGAAA